MGIVQSQNVVAVDHDHELQKCSEEIKICVTEHCPAQDPVGANNLQPSAEIAQGIPTELP